MAPEHTYSLSSVDVVGLLGTLDNAMRINRLALAQRGPSDYLSAQWHTLNWCRREIVDLVNRPRVSVSALFYLVRVDPSEQPPETPAAAPLRPARRRRPTKTG